MNHTEQQSSSEPTTSEQQSEPSTTVQSFPSYELEYYYNRMDQNQMIIHNTMRNFPWPDNSIHPMSMMDNLSMNSNLSYGRNMELVNSGSTNSNHSEAQPQTQQAESNNTETVCLQSPLVPYSDEAATALIENLRKEDTFNSALQTLITWMLKSEFNKSNTTYLFSMIQSAQFSVFRLMNDRVTIKGDFDRVKLEINQKLNGIISQFQEISKVFEVAKLQKVWDQFTKPQRKLLKTWIEETKEIMSTLQKELAARNMEPEEYSPKKSPDNFDLQQVAETENYEELREELNSLRNQLKAAEDEKTAEQNDLETMKRYQQEELREMDEECKELEKETESLKSFLAKVRSLNNTTSDESTSKPTTSKKLQPRLDANSAEEKVQKNENVSSEEVRLISLTGSYLLVHPFGASVEYIWSYLSLYNPSIDCRYVDNLLSRFPKIFRAESRGVGAASTKEWIFLGFEHVPKQN